MKSTDPAKVLLRLQRLPGASPASGVMGVDVRRTSTGSMPDATVHLDAGGAYFCDHGASGAEVLGQVVSALMAFTTVVRIEPLEEATPSRGSHGHNEDPAQWIYEDGLRSWLELIAHGVGYDFDDDDWAAVAHGVKQTDAEQDVWFEYPIGSAARVRLAVDPGSSVVMTSVVGSPEVSQHAAIATDVLQHFNVQRRK